VIRVEVLMVLAGCLALVGCVAGIQPSVQEVMRAENLVEQGALNLRRGELDQAEACFALAQELAPSAAALDGLGCVAMLRGDAKTAQKHFLNAYAFDENYRNSLGNLALLYESQGLMREARTLYERAITENPENFRFRNNFAAFLIDYGSGGRDRRIAAGELQKAKAVAPCPVVEHNLEKLAEEGP
jgi:Flp pilus assembly protein TadD